MVGAAWWTGIRKTIAVAGAALLAVGCTGHTIGSGPATDGGRRGTGGESSDAGPGSPAGRDAGEDASDRDSAVRVDGSVPRADAASSEAGYAPPCPSGAIRCGDVCMDVGYDLKNCGSCGAACAAGELCSAGVCSTMCLGGSLQCGTRCVDPENDPANCGSCGHACDFQSICSRGACTLACTTGTTECHGRCADLRSDVTACGSCDKACHMGEYCSNGLCAPVCPAPLIVCNGACTDPSNDPNHCGACDVRCSAGLVCSDGACNLECSGGSTRCGDACVATASDSANCGACGNACPATQYCLNGACTGCPPGQSACGGNCVDLQANLNNCGSCGNACPYIYYYSGSETCSNGACHASCTSGYATCSSAVGCGTSLNSDPSNCGACGNVCAAGEFCNGGTCFSCGPGLTYCSGSCADLTSNFYNCGACGATCYNLRPPSESTACVSGVCQPTGCYPGYGDCNRNQADGCEASFTSDLNNCGSCGTKCAANQVCSQGVCAACAPGETLCPNGCTDLQSSPSDCGACGTVCSDTGVNSADTCVRGACVPTCASGYLDCNSTELDGCETTMDSTHCGTCGTVCAKSDFCVDAKCVSCSPTDLGSVVPVTFNGTTVGRPDSFTTSCGVSGEKDAYFSFKAPAARSYVFTASASATVVLEARSGSCSGTFAGCSNAYPAQLTLPLAANQTVVVIVEYEYASGPFALTVN